MSAIMRAMVATLKNRDVTPGAVNWANISTPLSTPALNANQAITGITAPISLTPAFSGVSGLLDATWEMLVDEVSQFTNGIVIQPGSVIVSLGQNVRFRLNPGASSTGSMTITVTNSSDGGAVLDTFTCTAT